MYHNFFIHSSVDGHQGCFHVLATVNSTAINSGIHVSFSILVSSRYMSRNGTAGSYGGFVPSFLRNLHTIFHSACISLHPHQQCKSVPFSPHLLQHSWFVGFLLKTLLTGMRWYFLVVLICINNELCWASFHVCWPSVCFLRNVWLGHPSIFWLGFLFWSCTSCLCILEINPLSVVLFAYCSISPILRVVF